jgi:hypothetical protein
MLAPFLPFVPLVPSASSFDSTPFGQQRLSLLVRGSGSGSGSGYGSRLVRLGCNEGRPDGSRSVKPLRHCQSEAEDLLIQQVEMSITHSTNVNTLNELPLLHLSLFGPELSNGRGAN